MKNSVFYIILILLMTKFNFYFGLLNIPIFFLLIINRKIKFDKSIKFLWLIFFIALGSSFPNFGTYIFLKDFLFFFQVPIILSVIYSLPIDPFRLIKYLLVAIFVITITDLAIILFNLNEYLIMGNFTFQQTYQVNSPYAIIGFGLLFPLHKYKIRLFINKRYNLIFLFTFLVHILLSSSRTTIILLPLIYYSYKFINVKKVKILIILLILLPFFSSLIDILLSGFKISSETNLLSKFLSSFSEISVSGQNNDQKLITKNWRGFEAFLGVSNYINGSIIEILFGKGLGSYVIVPFGSFSQEIEGLTNISFFHNGIVTILLKSGLIGVLLFMKFLFSILKRLIILNDKTFKILSLNILLIFLFTTVSSHGIYKPSLSVPLIISLGIIFKLLSTIQLQKWKFQ